MVEELIIKGVTKLETKVIYVSTTKIGENTTNILKLLFYNKFTICHIKLNIYI